MQVLKSSHYLTRSCFNFLDKQLCSKRTNTLFKKKKGTYLFDVFVFGLKISIICLMLVHMSRCACSKVMSSPFIPPFFLVMVHTCECCQQKIWGHRVFWGCPELPRVAAEKLCTQFRVSTRGTSTLEPNRAWSLQCWDRKRSLKLVKVSLLLLGTL